MEIQKLFPECKDYLWGGMRLPHHYGKKTDKNPCAESWEISFHKDGLSKCEDGRNLCDVVTEQDLGENCKAFPFFPVLGKFIDAKENLSIQVHPSDAYALSNENSFGKTEMWYIVEAQKGAGIYLGFNKDVSKEEFVKAIEEHKLTDLLNFYEVKQGETYFIPSGTIHAIASGCLIYEIQQNSNLTYRVYDYGRKDKNGKERELHVEKALKVTNLNKFENHPLQAEDNYGKVLGMSKYFHTTKFQVDGEKVGKTSSQSFQCITCLDGFGTIQNKQMQKGDTYFIPANYGEYSLKGKMSIIMVSVRKYYVGIDLGGTFIKGGIVDSEGNLLLNDKVPTESDKGADVVAKNIANLSKNLMAKAGLQKEDVVGLGIGVPGMIDAQNGNVIYSNNLKWKDFRIGKKVEELVGLPVKIANDANVAALGEARFGCGKNYTTTVMITLGTGVGGGMVLDGKLFEGNNSVGAEIGHMGIVAGGELCSCGRRGCFEAYSSATALIRDTKRAMEKNKDTKMWEIGSLDNVDGATAFKYLGKDAVADAVVEHYIDMLAYGIANIANVIRPEAVILGGGICAEGKRLTDPLQEKVDAETFGKNDGPEVKIITAELGNRAGILGAAALFMN